MKNQDCIHSTTSMYHALAILLLLAGRAQAQSPAQLQSGAGSSKSNRIVIIAACATVAGLIVSLTAVVTYRRMRQKRNQARTGTGPDMTQTRPAAPPATTAATRPARRRPRQASTQTVPEYTEQANEEEMVLGKAEETITEEGDLSRSTGSSSMSRTPRTPYGATSRVTLQDIEPAVELRIDRYDTIASVGGTSLTSDENAHLLATGNNSTVNLNLEDVSLDGLPPSSASINSGRRHSSSSFFASPMYVNRSRSRSVDIFRPLALQEEDEEIESSAPRASLDVPRNRRTSGFKSLFPRKASQSNLLPLHQTIPAARRDALRNREISAPLADTRVRTSTTYVYPRAGLNPLQAAWLGSRDSITRLTTQTTAEPPDFTLEELEEGDEEDGDTAETGGDTASPGRRPLRISTTLTQLEEESAQLSSLVSRTSLNRHSLPPHLVALPPSVPSSPTAAGFSPVDGSSWPSGSRPGRLPRSASTLSQIGRVRGPRSSMDMSLAEAGSSDGNRRSSSIARRRVQSEAVATSTPRSQSPVPLSPSGSITRLASTPRRSDQLRREMSTNTIESFVSAMDGVQEQEEGGGLPRARKHSQRSLASFATAESGRTVQ